MRSITSRTTREAVFGAAALAVFLYMVVTNQSTPETLNALVFALVVNAVSRTAGKESNSASPSREAE